MVVTTIMLLVIGGGADDVQERADDQRLGRAARRRQPEPARRHQQLIRDLMLAGRIIGAEGIPMPTGAGAMPFNRPGAGRRLTFSTVIVDGDSTLNLPSITTGYQLGPTINGSATDIVTIMTVDEFMPVDRRRRRPGRDRRRPKARSRRTARR